jgi:hypothetical protein
MEAIYSSETSVETQRTTRRHIPEDDTLQILLKLSSIKFNENPFGGSQFVTYGQKWRSEQAH